MRHVCRSSYRLPRNPAGTIGITQSSRPGNPGAWQPAVRSIVASTMAHADSAFPTVFWHVTPTSWLHGPWHRGCKASSVNELCAFCFVGYRQGNAGYLVCRGDPTNTFRRAGDKRKRVRTQCRALSASRGPHTTAPAPRQISRVWTG
jgi:hypothetical protein